MSLTSYQLNRRRADSPGQPHQNMKWRVEIRHNKGVFDALAEGIFKSLSDLGVSSVDKVEAVFVYNIVGDLTEGDVKKIGHDLLADKVTQEFSYFDQATFQEPPGKEQIIEIAHNPGVMDPVEESTLKGIRDLGINAVQSVKTAQKYIFYGSLSPQEKDLIVNKILANKLIQHVVDHTRETGGDAVPSGIQKNFKLVLVALNKATDKELLELSRQGQLFLNLTEMKAIQNYFRKLGRNPTDCELETIAQTWSEHCYHKTFRGNIQYKYFENGKTKSKVIRNLLKSTIVKATKKINKSWCVSVFHDNAGVIKFDSKDCVCFKVETHNHPSALEPFGGANTGVGGVIRDILGTGLGAKPICSTDVFCFAPPDMPANHLPPGTIHPKRVMKGVVSGVRDYGNKMGIPTVNGAICFDKHFVGNPLVYCGNVGIMPKDKVKKKPLSGDLIVAVGGRTGRDGIHGATFSSGELTTESETISSGAVQIGNPIQEKKVLDGILRARDLGLYTAITDCGAGGFSSAVGEMGEHLGARVQLDEAPLKYDGLNYMEIWISESQERMVMSVPKKNIEKLLKVFADENVEAAVIGEFTTNKKLELFYENYQVCSLDMEFLHGGIPQITKKAVWKKSTHPSPRIPASNNLAGKLKEVLGHYNVCSKEWVIRQYDHEVQGMSVIKPLLGVNNDGPSDASVLAPKYGSKRGIAVSNGINFRYGMIDPYWMAVSCIDEAVRQIIAVGGNLDKIAILDNFCWGNPDKPDRLGSLVRAAEGCYQAAVGYGVPFISGKDSLYNEYTEGNKSIAIPGTLLISAIGIMDDVTKAVTMDFKKPGNLVYAVGQTFDELGGSIYLDTFGLIGNSVPQVNIKNAVKIFEALSRAVKKGLVRSIHDCSEGGLGVALAEMAFAGGFGVTAELEKVPFKGKEKKEDTILFSESNSRFLVEVEPKQQKKFEKLLRGIPFGLIGFVSATPEFAVYGLKKDICIKSTIGDLKDAWQKPLRW